MSVDGKVAGVTHDQLGVLALYQIARRAGGVAGTAAGCA